MNSSAFQYIVILFLSSLFSFTLNCSREKTDAYAKIIQQKKLLVGTDATYPPFESKDADTGKLMGFDIDLMDAICDKLGVKCEYIVVPFDGIVSGLNNNKYDAIISSFTITPQRETIVNFSKPYYQASQSIAVRLDQQKINSLIDLKGKIVGVQLGTTGELLAKKIEGAEIISFDNIGAAFIDLENRKLDAIINDKPTSQRIIALRGNAKLVGPDLSSENYGIAVRKGEKRLLDAINNALSDLQLSIKIDDLNKKWFSVQTRIQ
ncbi:MAG: basic amino acid ABC transporter substrate-binding protein [candidate division Zixibacteria bacterium]|nr:basic amino acid ABC transporter substrate-binding protein [candidate division Zixibacteria bacterium]